MVYTSKKEVLLMILSLSYSSALPRTRGVKNILNEQGRREQLQL